MAGTSGTGWSPEDKSTTELDAAAKAGDGGGVLGVHTAGRFERVLFYGNGDENLSSFSSPAGVTGLGWDSKPSTGQEKFTGVSVSGTFKESDGSLLSGTVQIIIGDPNQETQVSWAGETFTVGGIVAGVNTNGTFTASGPPPAGVFAGDNGNVGVSSMSALFSPSGAGVGYNYEFSSFQADMGTNTYGAAWGQILDYQGKPVPGIGVKAPGFGTNSGDDGKFKLQGPENQSVGIETLNGTVQDDITFQADPDPNDPQTYEFPALTLEVLDAEYEPAGSAQVEIEDTTYYTDDDGTLTLSPLGLSDYDVTVMDQFEATLTLDEQGVEYVFTVGPDSKAVDWTPDPSKSLGGVKITAIDEQTGRKIRRVSATVDELGIVDTSDKDGVVKLLSTEVGLQDVTVLLATGDKRYNPSAVEIAELPDGQMATATVQLRRKDQVVNI